MSMNTLVKVNIRNTCNNLNLKSLQQQSYQAKTSCLCIFHFWWHMSKIWIKPVETEKYITSNFQKSLVSQLFCLLLDAGSPKNTEANNRLGVFNRLLQCNIWKMMQKNRSMTTDFRDLRRQTSLPLPFWTVAPLTFAITCGIEDGWSLFQSFMRKHFWLASP